MSELDSRADEPAGRSVVLSALRRSWVAIAAVPTMIAGIYGMNFEHMPELKWQYGYYLVLTVIIGTCGLLYARFKRNGWL